MTVVPISPIIEDGREWWPSAKEETLFIFEESPFPLDELVPNWLEVRRHHGPAIDLFYLSHYSDTPSPKVRFLLVFHALERFHRLSGFDQDRWDLRDYKRILAAVQNLSDLTPEQRGWVVPKLQHNEVSQRRRLTDIVKPLADVYGGVVRPNLGEFVEIIVESRNALVHQLARPAESAITDARGLDILAAVLRIFLETHLLAETGHSLDEVADRMHDTRRFKEAFSYWVPFLVQVGVL